MRCETCGVLLEIEHDPEDAVEEHSHDTWTAGNAGRTVASLGTHVLSCEGCRATTESTDLSTACQFCGGHLVALSSPEGVVPPEAVVPFQVDAVGARDAFERWVTSRWLAVKALKRVNGAESLRGTYLPYWTFDAATASEYTGQRGEDYTVKVDDDRTERRTRWHAARGSVRRSFDDVVVPGRSEAPALRRALGTVRLSEAVPYRPEYVAGYSTARYEIDPAEGLVEAKRSMASEIRKDVRRAIGGDRQKIEAIETAYSAVMFKLVLVPIWMATYMYGGKQWQLFVDGTTGKVSGSYPIDKVKVAVLVLVALVVVAVGVWLVMTYYGATGT